MAIDNKCPKCNTGTLELLTRKEKQKLNSEFLSEKILGCDECNYWIEEDIHYSE